MLPSATIHTPAASVYANYLARPERRLPNSGSSSGSDCCCHQLLRVFIGILTMSEYGPESGVVVIVAQLAIDGGPILGGIALAAVLAAVISSGAPILLASATMFVNDWIPGSKDFGSEKKLFAYKSVTVIYGLVPL